MIPEVEGIRFLALCAVVLHHVTAGYLERTERLGPADLPRDWWQVFPQSPVVAVGYAAHFGLPIFFALSGFILAVPAAQEAGRSPRGVPGLSGLRAYYLRRLVRIEPPYVANLLVASALLVLMHPDWRVLLTHLPATLFYLHGPIYGEASWINGVVWSLEVEVQYYLVAPLIAAAVFACRRPLLRRVALVAAMLGLGVVARAYFLLSSNPRLALSVLAFLHLFVAGILVADLYAEHGDRGPLRGVRGAVADLTALGALGAIFWILTRRYDLFALSSSLVVILFVALYLGPVGRRILRLRWAVLIGGMSYSIYLYHQLVLDALGPWLARIASPSRPMALDLALQCAVAALPILAVAVIAFVTIERPCMVLSSRIRRRRREPREQSPGVWIHDPEGALTPILDTPPIRTVPPRRGAPVGVHVLVQDAHLLPLLWSLVSFYRHAGVRFPLTVHLQGCAGASLRRRLPRVFPDAAFVAQRRADDAVERELRRIGLDRLLAARRELFLMMKLVDVALLARTRRILFLDPDVLFFRHPGELLAAASGEGSCFLRDDHESYRLSPRQARDDLGIELVERLNTGLMTWSAAALDLELADRLLGHPELSKLHWHTEQTLHALLASRRGDVELLPDSYRMASGPVDLGAGVVARHYTTPVRALFLSEGVARLRRELGIGG